MCRKYNYWIENSCSSDSLTANIQMVYLDLKACPASLPSHAPGIDLSHIRPAEPS